MVPLVCVLRLCRAVPRPTPASRRRPFRAAVLVLACGALQTGPVAAQVVETVGSRALGMGGAFVAVANDSSATWWNPAGLATGPFFDASLAGAAVQQGRELPGWRATGFWFAAGTPPFGLGYYRLELATVDNAGDGVDGAAELRSLPVTQIGVTLVQTIVSGVHGAVHAGGTIKYLRGSLLRASPDDLVLGSGSDPGVSSLLEWSADLDGGRTEHQLDFDAGIIGVGGPVRVGAVIRNIRQPTFGDTVSLTRQFRAGVAFDAAQLDMLPLMVSLDADLRAYETVTGLRQVVALGAEQWLLERRLALRGGARVNTTGARERAVSAGASVALRPGMFFEGHIVRGGAPGEQGWGLGARVSF